MATKFGDQETRCARQRAGVNVPDSSLVRSAPVLPLSEPEMKKDGDAGDAVSANFIQFC